MGLQLLRTTKFLIPYLIFVAVAVILSQLPVMLQTNCAFRLHDVAFDGLRQYKESCRIWFAPLQLILAVGYLFATAAVGWGLFQSFLDQLPTRPTVRVVIGFFPGFLVVSAVNRAVSYLLPHAWAPSFLLTIWAMSLLYLIYQNRSSFRAYRSGAMAIPILLAMILVGLLVFGVSPGTQFLARDGVDVFLQYYANLARQLPGQAHFPLVDQHYGEEIFVYPLVMMMPDLQPLWLMWLCIGLMKLSVGCFLYAVFRSEQVSKPFALLGVAYLFLGSFTLSPVRYLFLFDSLNPLAFNIQADRILGDALPWLMYLLFIRYAPTTKISVREGFAFFWLGAGVAATSFQNAGFLVVLSLSVLIAGRLREKIASLDGLRWGLALVLVTTLLAYGRDTALTGTGIPLVIALSIVVTLTIASLRPKKKSEGRPNGGRIFFLVAGLVFSSLFLGNIFAKSFHEKLLGPQPVITRGVFNVEHEKLRLFTPAFDLSLKEPTSDFHWSFSTFHFSAWYGLGLVMALLAVFAFAKYSKSERAGLFSFSALLLMIFLAGLFLKDFSQFGVGQGLRPRFFEPAYYTLLSLFLIAVYRYYRERHRRAIAVLLVLWIITPLVAQRQFEQWVVNARYLFTVAANTKPDVPWYRFHAE